jgi:signal transduction histidine kinase
MAPSVHGSAASDVVLPWLSPVGASGTSDALLLRMHAGLERQARAIGQLLHDEAGQLLAAAYLALDDAQRHLPSAAHDHLQGVRGHLAAVEEHLRHIAHELRPRILDDLGLAGALEFLSRSFESRHGIPTRLSSRLDTRLPATIETVVYRIAQEGLTNVARHARASQVSIAVAISAGGLWCAISDDGVGFEMPAVAARRTAALGVYGLRDRVEALDGKVWVRSSPGAGTDLIVRIPLEW